MHTFVPPEKMLSKANWCCEREVSFGLPKWVSSPPLGMETVRVIRRPVVAILATGDELLDAGEAIEPGKIYDANSHSLAALVVKYGGIPLVLGIARDNLQDMNQKLSQGTSSDLLITSAGVSKGDYDMWVKDVLMERGEISFWSVRMKPGQAYRLWGDQWSPMAGEFHTWDCPVIPSVQWSPLKSSVALPY